MKLPQCLVIIVNIILSQGMNAQWTNTGGPPSRAIQCFTVTDLNIIAGTDGGLVGSTNNGASWTNIGSGIPYLNIRAVLPVSSYPFNVLAGTINGRISKSSNYGSTWDGFPVDSVQMPALAHVNAILKNTSEFWVGTDRGIYLLPQYYPLSTWIPWHSGLLSGGFTVVRALWEKDGDIFAGTNSGVYKLNVSTWVQKNTGLSNTNVTALRSTGGYLVAGTSQGTTGGVYISSDNGENWALSKPDPWVTSILTIGSTIFVGSFGDGVWRSTNYGSTWSQINDGLGGAAYYVLSLGADGQYIFAGTNNANVWRRPLSQVTDAKDETRLQPEVFSLEQNYPNPFNPTTRIDYALPYASHVRLTVYNLLGQPAATLVDEDRPAGRFAVEWNGAGTNGHTTSSGVYFYRLEAGQKNGQFLFSGVKKMILMK